MAPGCGQPVDFLLSPGCEGELLFLARAHSCWFQCVFLGCETDRREREHDHRKVLKT